MKYLGIIILFIVLSLCYVIARAIAFTNRNIEKSRNEFLSRESKANATRRQDISGLDYLTPDLTRIPMSELKSSGCNEYIAKLNSMSNVKMLNLSMYSNTDLKLMYGPANLDELSAYDNNYTEFIRLLNKLAEAMLSAENHNTSAVRQILEYAVEIGSDITQTYVNLAHIYIDAGDKASLRTLTNQAKKITSLSGKTIVNKLTQLQKQ